MLYLLAVLFLAFAVLPAFAHGGGPYDEVTLNLDDRNVTISTMIHPADLTAESLDDARFTVNFFDNDTQKNFDNVTYKLAIYKHGDLLANNYFYAENGMLNVEVRPIAGCPESVQWRCTVYYGTPHPINGALYAQGQSNPVISGPIIFQGGLFHFQIQIVGAEFPNRMLDKPLTFDTFVSVAKEQTFYISQDASGAT